MGSIIAVDIPKPEFGQPCNGCGYCCIQEPCQLALEILGDVAAPCPALEIDSGRYFCGIVRRPAWYMFAEDVPESKTAKLSSLFAAALGLGVGCDATDPTHPHPGDK